MGLDDVVNGPAVKYILNRFKKPKPLIAFFDDPNIRSVRSMLPEESYLGENHLFKERFVIRR